MTSRSQAILLAFLVSFLVTQIFLTTSAQSPKNSIRTWTSKDGKFSIEASFLSFVNGIVKLQKSDGRELNVPVDRLSFADQKFLSSETKWGRVWRNANGKELFIAKLESTDAEKVEFTDISGNDRRMNLSSLDSDSQNIVLRQKGEQSSDPSTQDSGPGKSSTIVTPLNTLASEAAIRQLISDCEKLSRRIRIDGRERDWKALPTFDDDTTIDEGSLDIVRVGIAPRKSDLIVMIQTRKRPAREDFAFFIRVDFLGQHEYDFQIGLSRTSAQTIKVYDETKDSQLIAEQKLDGVNVQVRDVVEVQIPYSALESVLPQEMKDFLFGEQSRPFMRVETFSFDRESRSISDYGPSAASYRFLSDEYPLDARAPGDLRPVLPVSVPFEGKWFVGNGAMGYRAHVGVHAYDFYIMDRQLQAAKVRRSTDNSDYYCWGQPILNPIDATVIRVDEEYPDNTPMDKTLKPANAATLSLPGHDDLRLRLLHFQQNLIEVQTGQKLRKGEIVGMVGNSGFSGFPHLHMDLMVPSQGDKFETIPLAFDQAILSLNPTPDDPWTRYVENWEIRAGVFVEKPQMPQTSER